MQFLPAGKRRPLRLRTVRPLLQRRPGMEYLRNALRGAPFGVRSPELPARASGAPGSVFLPDFIVGIPLCMNVSAPMPGAIGPECARPGAGICRALHGGGGNRIVAADGVYDDFSSETKELGEVRA